jgi:NAD(P)-dependent dehydrogenase (short-subunit alcohol dehydrogenase family)
VRLNGSRVVVIGASESIGLATARAAAAAGADVVIASRSLERLERARATIAGQVEIAVLDITREDELEPFFARIGALDHLVVSTVHRSSGPMLELDEESSRLVFETKLWGPVAAIRHAVPRTNPRGSITLFSGVSSWKPFVGSSIGAAANGAVNAVCRSLALELAPLRVNAVSPGPMFRTTVVPEPPAGVSRDDEVAAAVLFLMESELISGTVLHAESHRQFVG